MADSGPLVVRLEYRLDRHLPDKLARACARLAPLRQRPARPTSHEDVNPDQDSRHLCPGVVGPPEGERDDRQSDGRSAGMRSEARTHRAA